MSPAFPWTLPASCSVRSGDLGESAYGSAADATSWVCLEQSGPWGRAAATESHLNKDLGQRLDAAVSAVGGRFVLIRVPGAHPDDPRHQRPHRVLLVSSTAAAGWVLRAEIADPAMVEALDLDALSRGDEAAVRASLPALIPDPTPTLLLCTNGRRDVCCAVRGRPVALGVAAQRPGQVWETSHTGGHRFAPTGVLLPSGQTLARLDNELAVQALDGAGQGRLAVALHGPVHDRGASGLTAPVRAAVSAVRAATGTESLVDLLATTLDGSSDDTERVVVRHIDGRQWQVQVRQEAAGPDRAESCSKPPVPQVVWNVTLVAEGTPARGV